MKTFKEYLESEAPASVDANVGKPGGGGKTDMDARLERMRKRRGDSPETFEELFAGAAADIRKALGKE